MTTVFVTSSGTDIGKTEFCCRLLESLPADLAIRCVKPVVTGFSPDRIAESDTSRLLAAQGLALEAAAIESTSPWRFAGPLSPDMAAARERRSIPFVELVAFSRAPAGVALNLVEGIGGIMVPLDARHTVLDWVEALDPRVVLVVGSYLGSLSHTLTALAALTGRGIRPTAIVVSESPDEPVPTAETIATLERFTEGVPITALPRQKSADPVAWSALVERLLVPA